MRGHLVFAGAAVLAGWSPLVSAAPTPASPVLASPTLPSEGPVVKNAIRTGVLRFRTVLRKGGMMGVIGDVRDCYRPADYPGKQFQLLACLSEDDAGYTFSTVAAISRHFSPLRYYQRATFYARQNEIVSRAKALPAKLQMSFINTALNLVAQEMQVVMGPPNKQ